MHEEHSFVLFSVCQRTLGSLVKPGMNLVMPGMTPYVMPDLNGHLFLLQRLGRIGADGTEGLPEDGAQGD